MQLAYYQNTAISLRETVQGPLNHWILTHEQNLSKQLLQRADSVLPHAQSWQATGTLTAGISDTEGSSKSQPHVDLDRYTHTLTQRLLLLPKYNFLYVCIHTPGSRVGTDVSLFCISACHSWWDYPPPYSSDCHSIPR